MSEAFDYHVSRYTIKNAELRTEEPFIEATVTIEFETNASPPRRGPSVSVMTAVAHTRSCPIEDVQRALLTRALAVLAEAAALRPEFVEAATEAYWKRTHKALGRPDPE